jgi:hypothetical protein
VFIIGRKEKVARENLVNYNVMKHRDSNECGESLSRRVGRRKLVLGEETVDEFH